MRSAFGWTLSCILAVCWTGSASAQSSKWKYCAARSVETRNAQFVISKANVVSDPYPADDPYIGDEAMLEKFRAANVGPYQWKTVYCATMSETTEEEALARVEQLAKHYFTEFSYGNWGYGFHARVSPSAAPDKRAIADAAEKTLRLDFRSANLNESGYNRAYFDLRYKFIVCAGDVQVAYSADPKTLKTFTYNVSSDGQHYAVTPLRPTPMPLTIRLEATVKRADQTGTLFLLKDAIAGEALGMGCFTGQTKTVGPVSKLVGASAKPADVSRFLAGLFLDHRLGPIDQILTHPDIVAPKVPQNSGRFRAYPVPGTTQIGKREEDERIDPAYLARLKAETDSYAAMKAASIRAKADYAKAQAAYASDKAAHDAAVRKSEAQAIEYEAKMERWRQQVAACKAGKRAECVQ